MNPRAASPSGSPRRSGPLLIRIRDMLGAGLVVIEHDMPLLAGMADRLIALDQGSLLVEGTPDAVLRDPLVIASYLGENATAIARSDAVPGPTGPLPPPERRGRPAGTPSGGYSSARRTGGGYDVTTQVTVGRGPYP